MSTKPVATCKHCSTSYTLEQFLALPLPLSAKHRGTAVGDAGGGWTYELRDCTCVRGATFSILRDEHGNLVE